MKFRNQGNIVVEVGTALVTRDGSRRRQSAFLGTVNPSSTMKKGGRGRPSNACAPGYALSAGDGLGSAPREPLSGGGAGLFATGFGGRGGRPAMMSWIWSASRVSHSRS